MTMRHLWRCLRYFPRVGRQFLPNEMSMVPTCTQVVNLSVQSRRWDYKNNRFQRDAIAAGVSLGFLGFFNKNEDEDEEPELIMTIKRSILLIQKGEYKKAEQMLHVALRQAQTLQNEDGITYVYDVMGNLAFEVGENTKAMDLFKSVMQRLLSTGTTQDDKKIIHISLKVAKILERMEDYEAAEQGFQFCLEHAGEHVKKTPDDEDAIILYGLSLDWYANMLLAVGRYNESLDNYLQAYQWCLKAFGKNHEQTVVILNDLGTVCSLLGQEDRALGYLSDALETGRNISDASHLSAIHVNLGKVYMKKALFNEATKACNEGLKLAKKSEDIECQEQANDCLIEVNKFLKK